MHIPLKHKLKRKQRAELQEDTGFTAEQFTPPEAQIPWKAIGLASLLFTMGSILISVGVLIKLEIIATEEYLSRAIPLLVLGSIMFIPGKLFSFL
ncbi:hypothetical protein BCR42DRAFT_425264 [Absidia repens]|uniref:Transmembrane protein 230 n=1 Tax=Absidia repens TaxID=90262 RepID=A0A1X2I463_9FUNG|nr:hypothetical protein BCR42DRAFT_425264 [Absidia repens]